MRQAQFAWLCVASLLVLTASTVLVLAMLPGLQTAHRLAVQLSAFAPHACLAWLLATALFLAAGDGWQRGLAVVPVAGLVGNLALIVPYVPYQTAGTASSLSVVTLNLRCYPVDAESLVTAVRSRSPDIVLLQDTPRRTWSDLQARGWGADYPAVVARPTPSQSEARAEPCESWLSARAPLTPSAAQPIGAGQVAYRVDLPGGAILALPVTVTNPTTDVQHWAQDLAEVRQTALAQTGPLVVLGDFNAVREHLPLRELRAAGLTDAAEQAKAGWVPTFPGRGWLPPLLAIDHVMVNAGLRATSLTSFAVPGCDHRGLFARLTRTGVG